MVSIAMQSGAVFRGNPRRDGFYKGQHGYSQNESGKLVRPDNEQAYPEADRDIDHPPVRKAE
jgi:hypothetical protein